MRSESNDTELPIWDGGGNLEEYDEDVGNELDHGLFSQRYLRKAVQNDTHSACEICTSM